MRREVLLAYDKARTAERALSHARDALERVGLTDGVKLARKNAQGCERLADVCLRAHLADRDDDGEGVSACPPAAS